MRAKSSFRNQVFGTGLPIALTVTLVIAAGLVVLGLARELTSARMTVVAEHRPPLIASQVMVAPLEHGPASDADGAADDESDPDADFHPGAEAVPGPNGVPARVAQAVPQTGGPAGEGSTSGDGSLAAGIEGGGETRPAPAASPAAEALAPEAAPEPSPEAAAEAAPSPQPVAARPKPAPGPRGPPRASADLPIVMYHHVGPLPPRPDQFRRDLTVSPEVFDQTLEQLAAREVQTVTMADLFEHFAGGPELPKRSAILTFDDGYDDVYEYAFHSLQKRGMVGTFFISTDFVERPGYVTWAQIQEMADAGMEIAAHSTNHPDFTLIGPAELRRQLVEPKAILEEHLGQKIRFLAYPSGKYNAAVMAASKAAGYEAAVTVIHGTRHVPSMAFELRRVRAHGADSVGEIVARMTPAAWRQ